MKLFIEVEISADEIPLATELFRTLRTLTDHVKTRERGKIFQTLISRLEDGDLDKISEEICTLLKESGELAFEEFFQAFISVVFNKDLVVRQQSVVPFMLLLPRLIEPAQSQMRELLISKILKHLTIKRPIEASRMDFFAHAEAFAALASVEMVTIPGTVTTITKLLQKPETRCAAVTMLGKTVELCRQQLNDHCDQKILEDLNEALSNVNEEVFQYDINYIEESMNWPQRGTAPLDQGGGPGAVAQAQGAISAVDNSSTIVVDGSSPISGLRPVDSYLGHRSTIFAMCYDEGQQQLVSGGKDGTLITWSPEGQAIETSEMSRHYACSMDVHPSHRTLLVCGVAKDDVIPQSGGRMTVPPPPPCIVAYAPVGRGWSERGLLSKESSKLVSCIKAVGHGAEHAFVTGETLHTVVGEGGVQRLDERVCYYDIQQSSSFSTLQPVHQYSDHKDLITCVSLLPPNPDLFMSGSRDFTVRVWDRRSEGCVGMFGVMSKSGRIQAHDQMITCLDASDPSMVLSAGMDMRVLRWDFRKLSQSGSPPVGTIKLDDTGVLKVALGGGPKSAAVSTLRGLYMIDLTAPLPVVRLAERFPDGRCVGRYHDLKWAHGRQLLYAAGDDMRVDVYSFYK